MRSDSRRLRSVVLTPTSRQHTLQEAYKRELGALRLESVLLLAMCAEKKLSHSFATTANQGASRVSGSQGVSILSSSYRQNDDTQPNTQGPARRAPSTVSCAR